MLTPKVRSTHEFASLDRGELPAFLHIAEHTADPQHSSAALPPSRVGDCLRRDARESCFLRQPQLFKEPPNHLAKADSQWKRASKLAGCGF
jgi:hypothetical protein